MLLFDTGKRLEKAVGEEAACIIMQVFEQYDENAKQELATRGDLQLEIEKVRAEVEKVRTEIKSTELRLQSEMQKMKIELIKWQIGGLISLAAIMAKGFGWLGF